MTITGASSTNGARCERLERLRASIRLRSPKLGRSQVPSQVSQVSKGVLWSKAKFGLGIALDLGLLALDC